MMAQNPKKAIRPTAIVLDLLTSASFYSLWSGIPFPSARIRQHEILKGCSPLEPMISPVADLCQELEIRRPGTSEGRLSGRSLIFSGQQGQINAVH